MGRSIMLRCTCCGQESEVAWGKEFYVAPGGEEKAYGFPNPVSEEAIERGISGFWVDKICKDCGEVIRESRYIEDVTNEYTEAWISFPKVDIVECCDKCQSKDILTLYEVVIGEDAKIPCPKCKDGRFEVQKVYQE